MGRAKTVGLQLRLPPEMHERLKLAAETQGKSLNALICECIDDAGRPSRREVAALGILRRQALAEAVKVADLGEHETNTAARAEYYLAFMLGEV